MGTASWTEGYVADFSYAVSFCPDQAAVHLNFVSLINGFVPLPADRPLICGELASGQGLTANLLAAANPRDSFYAVDFNPAHVAGARALAAAAGLDNVRFLEYSFEELLAEPADRLPEFDIITLHGIYSWVDPANRRAIVGLLRRHLKPGGVAYVSYNSMPGAAALRPIQRVLHEVAALSSGRSDRRLEAALEFCKQLAAAGAPIFADSPSFKRILENWQDGNVPYLVHEYLNAHWHPMYHADVARELSEAKLDFVGTSIVLESFAELTFTPEQRGLLATVGAAEVRETLKDLFLPRLLRRDVYMRGPRRLMRAQQEALLREQTLALVVPRGRRRLSFDGPIGRAEIDGAVYDPIFDRLAAGPCSIGELLDLPEVRRRSKMQAPELAGMLVGSGQAMPAMSASAAALGRVAAFNRLAARRSRENPIGKLQPLAAARLGTGIHVSGLEGHVFDELGRGTRRDADALAREICRLLSERGESIAIDGKPLETEAEAVALVRDRTQLVLDEILPLWATLGVI